MKDFAGCLKHIFQVEEIVSYLLILDQKKIPVKKSGELKLQTFCKL